MNTAERIYEMVKTLPDEQAIEVLGFVETLQVRSPHRPAAYSSANDPSKTLDFRQAAGLGQEMWSRVEVEEYVQQERSAWD